MKFGIQNFGLIIGFYFTTFFEIKLIISQTQITPDFDTLLTEIFGNVNDSQNIKNCSCISTEQCNKYNNSVITTGEGLIDIRITQCTNSSKPCCDEIRNSQVTSQPPSLSPPYRRTKPCGYRHENGVGFRITSGNNEAQFGEFPWMVAIMSKTEHGPKYHCGGSLIHLKVVLTAAHCVIAYKDKTDQLILRAGEWDSQSEAEIISYQERTADKIIVHNMYLSGPAYNDIALILLKENFQFAENVDLICLPYPEENVDDTKCVASGWGKDKFGDKGVYQNILKRVDLPIVPRDKCQNLLRTTRLGSRFILHVSAICAGGERGTDTCKGDGGSPLVCPIPKKLGYYQQIGIVSWGISCGEAIPGVYASVPQFRNWIDEQFLNNSLDSSYYQNSK